MISSTELINFLEQNKVTYYSGVPDSLLKNLCSKLIEKSENPENNIVVDIASNEGVALANVIGYYLAEGRMGVVFLQNAGLGNLYNPYVSLSSQEVFNIPTLLLIGWRGEPNVPDEAQHKLQGKITLKTLEMLEIDYRIITKSSEISDLELQETIKNSIQNRKTLALVFSKGSI